MNDRAAVASSPLRQSVGFGGINLPDDVRTVQTLLQRAGANPGPADGVCGPATIAAIRTYQRRFLPNPDWRIDPGGLTYRKLTGDPSAPGNPAVAAGEWSGDSSQWTQEKKLQSLDPDLRPKIESVLSSLRNQGFQPKIVFGWRSVEVQHQLLLQGKTQVAFGFHNAQLPDGTPHSHAVDIIDVRWAWTPAAEANGFWAALGKTGKDLGLVWGGDWTGFPDVAHLQNRQNSELAAVKRESGL